MGLEQIYQMTNNKSYSLKLTMETADGDKGEVRYTDFKLTDNVIRRVEYKYELFGELLTSFFLFPLRSTSPSMSLGLKAIAQ